MTPRQQLARITERGLPKATPLHEIKAISEKECIAFAGAGLAVSTTVTLLALCQTRPYRYFVSQKSPERMLN
jgi:hypothetical protein